MIRVKGMHFGKPISQGTKGLAPRNEDIKDCEQKIC